MIIEQTENGRFLIDDQLQQQIRSNANLQIEQLKRLPGILKQYAWDDSPETVRGIIGNRAEYLKQRVIKDTETALITAKVPTATAKRYAADAVQDIPAELLAAVDAWCSDYYNTVNSMPVQAPKGVDRYEVKRNKLTLNAAYIQALLDGCCTPITAEEEQALTELRKAVELFERINGKYNIGDIPSWDSIHNVPCYLPGLAGTLIGHAIHGNTLADADILATMRRFTRSTTNK